MNNFFFTAALFLGLSISAFGQESLKLAMSKSASELATSKLNGNYSFILPKGTTAADVETSAKYYTLYFKVNYNESTQESSIVMVTNDEKSRHVICRFMSASKVDKINVDGKEFTLEDFFVAYLK